MIVWPLLYVKEKWCESNISGQVYKASFLAAAILQCAFYIQIKNKKTQCSRSHCSYFFTVITITSETKRGIQIEILDFVNNFELLNFQFDC